MALGEKPPQKRRRNTVDKPARAVFSNETTVLMTIERDQPIHHFLPHFRATPCLQQFSGALRKNNLYLNAQCSKFTFFLSFHFFSSFFCYWNGSLHISTSKVRKHVFDLLGWKKQACCSWSPWHDIRKSPGIRYGRLMVSSFFFFLTKCHTKLTLFL